MTTIDNTLIGKTIKLSIYPSTLITHDFTNCSILGIGNYVIANGYINAAEMHAMVYPMLPVGTSNNYLSYEYAIIKLANGTITAVGIPWIIADSVVVSTGITATVTISNLAVEDIDRIRLALLSNAFDDFQITTTS